MYFDRYFGSHAMLCRHLEFFFFFSKCHVIKISKIFGDFVSLCQGLLPTSRHFENRRGEDPGDEVAANFPSYKRDLQTFMGRQLCDY